MLNVAHAGVISDAPSLLEIIMSALRTLLEFAGGLAVLAIIISGIMYMTSTGDLRRIELAKKALIGSIIGLVVILIALIIVSQVAKIIAG